MKPLIISSHCYRHILFPIQIIIELFLNDYYFMLFSIDLLWYLCVLVVCSCWQYGCTSQLASDKQYRLQAQLAHVVSRIDILFIYLFFNTQYYFVCVLSIYSTPCSLIFFQTIILISCMNYIFIYKNISNRR